MSSDAAWSTTPDGVTLRVRVQPGGSRNVLEGVRDGELHIRLAARPVEGAANAALVRFLSNTLGVRKGDIELASGHTSRSKLLRVRTSDLRALVRLLETRAEGRAPERLRTAIITTTANSLITEWAGVGACSASGGARGEASADSPVVIPATRCGGCFAPTAVRETDEPGGADIPVCLAAVGGSMSTRIAVAGPVRRPVRVNGTPTPG